VLPIPLADVQAQYSPLLAELERRIGDVVRSGRFVLGPNGEAFEREAASYLGVRHAIGVGNGTDALVLTLDALGVSQGDEVICPAFTFYATAEAVARLGATPVFCDIDAATLNLDPADVAARVTQRTKAIVAVHLFGRPAPIELLPHGIPVVEDAAQAFGAVLSGGGRAGSRGLAGTFSFYPSKNLFAFGDGGLIVTSDDELAGRVRLLRTHGTIDGKRTFVAVGYNSRLDEIHAATLRLFLGELERWNRERREAASRYRELGLGAVCELPQDDPGHVYHMYLVRSPERESLLSALQEAQIGSAVLYPTPLHLQPVFRYLGYEEGSLPEAERASRENLALPLWAGITAEQQQRVVECVLEATRIGAAR
jgi:dTDP-4-amino-4,6-dideoxygalactose transaminase